MEKLKVFTAFSGYDSQCLALKYLDIPFDLVGWSEIDKFAIKAHNALFPEYAERNYGDISKIDWSEVPDFDLFTYSSPCQDFSSAGLQRGGEAGSGTRSSLLWECRRAIEAKRPKYLLFENVKALVSNKFIGTFNQWRATLDRFGYSSFAQVLNAKDYRVPQNRERVFLVSILGDATYHFPKPVRLEKRLKDVLEKNVDESYYLSDDVLDRFYEYNERNKAKGNGFRFSPSDGGGTARAILTMPGSRECDNYIEDKEKNKQRGVDKSLRQTLVRNDLAPDKVTYIDTYNKSVSTDGVTGTITGMVNAANHVWLAEPKNVDSNKTEEQ